MAGQALNTAQVMERFQIGSTATVLAMFKAKGSPSYKIGSGRGSWRVDEDDFKKFMQEYSAKYKYQGGKTK